MTISDATHVRASTLVARVCCAVVVRDGRKLEVTMAKAKRKRDVSFCSCWVLAMVTDVHHDVITVDCRHYWSLLLIVFAASPEASLTCISLSNLYK